MTPAPSSRAGKLLRAGLSTLLGLAIALVGLELGLRFLLFSKSSFARRLGAPWRKAEWYAQQNEDAYWKLVYLFTDRERWLGAHRPDPVCGWTGRIDPKTYLPAKPVDVRGRRPVLLYGDSFANCATPDGECFEDLLERSDLADRYCLVNYGVGGYGVDQELILLRQSIDLWKDKNPIVVLSFLVDDDFQRNLLSFRSSPKPRFQLEDGRLVTVPVDALDVDESIARHPVGIPSYLWRFAVLRDGLLPEKLARRVRVSMERRQDTIALGERILEEMNAELEARGLQHFFLVFHGWAGLQPRPVTQWLEDFARETLARIGARTIETRPFLLAAADGSNALAQNRLIGGTPQTSNHYNELGNIVAFEALRQGIEGRFDAPDTSRVAGIVHRPPFAVRSMAPIHVSGFPGAPTGGDPTAVVRGSRTPYAPFDRAAKQEYLILKPGKSGTASLEVAPPERAFRFRGTAFELPRERAGAPARPPLVLTVRLDGRPVFGSRVAGWPQPTEFDLELAGPGVLEITAERDGDATGDAWIHIADPRIE